MMASTRVRLPKAPTELPIILISVLRVGQDLANLNTLSCKKKKKEEDQVIRNVSALKMPRIPDLAMTHTYFDLPV